MHSHAIAWKLLALLKVCPLYSFLCCVCLCAFNFDIIYQIEFHNSLITAQDTSSLQTNTTAEQDLAARALYGNRVIIWRSISAVVRLAFLAPFKLNTRVFPRPQQLAAHFWLDNVIQRAK